MTAPAALHLSSIAAVVVFAFAFAIIVLRIYFAIPAIRRRLPKRPPAVPAPAPHFSPGAGAGFRKPIA